MSSFSSAHQIPAPPHWVVTGGCGLLTAICSHLSNHGPLVTATCNCSLVHFIVKLGNYFLGKMKEHGNIQMEVVLGDLGCVKNVDFEKN